MLKENRGNKVVCPNCSAKFYDLNREDFDCPMCHTAYVIDVEEEDSVEEAVIDKPTKTDEPDKKSSDDVIEDDSDLASLVLDDDNDDDDGKKDKADDEIDDTLLSPDDDEEDDVSDLIGEIPKGDDDI